MIVFFAGGAAFMIVLNWRKLIQGEVEKIWRRNWNHTTLEL